MAKLTNEQLMILDNLIYLREIANGGDEFRTVDDLYPPNNTPPIN